MSAKNRNVAFQRMLEELLEPVRDCADRIVDDVIVSSGTPDMSEEALFKADEAHLIRLLDLLARFQPPGSSDKATIAVREIEFAGHVVGGGLRKPIPAKIAAVEH